MIYIYCESCHEVYFLDYINSLIANYLLEIKYINEYHNIIINPEDILIFIKNIPSYYNIKIPNKIFVINTEQMTKTDIIEKIRNIPYNIDIIDYSKTNIETLINIGKKAYYLPYMFNWSEIYDLPKTNDVAVIGWWNSLYRKNILYELEEKRINVHHIKGFDRERDRQLFSHRILVNVHFDPSYKILEQMRCNRCIFNKMIVISEKSHDIDYELKPYMIECEYNNISEKVKEVLENYDFYYKQLFENLDLELIESQYKTISDTCINQIKAS
jgi:hypothetical protein